MISSSTSPPPTKRRHRGLRRIVYGMVGLIASVLLLLAAFAAYIGTESGLRYATRGVNWLTNGAVHINAVQGRLWHEVDIRGIRIETETFTLATDSVHLRWQPSRLLWGELKVQQLHIGSTRIDAKPALPRPASATKAPLSLTLPIAVQLEEVTLARLALNNDTATVNDVALTLKSNGVNHQLSVQQAATVLGRLQGRATLSGIAPFVTQAQVDLQGSIAEKPVIGTLQLSGSLRQLYALGKVESAAVNADLDLLLDLFAPYQYETVRRGKFALNGFAPHLLSASAPKAQISLLAEVQPVDTQQTVGTLRITNTQPGAIDLHGIPVQTLAMNWRSFSHHIEMDTITVRVGKEGQLTGNGTLQPDRFTLNLAAQNIALHDLVFQQASGVLAGEVIYQGPYHAPTLKLDLYDPSQQRALLLQTGWRTSSQEHTLLLQQLLLRQARSTLHATGELGWVGGQRPFKLSTRMQAFNPAAFGPYPVGDVNMTAHAEGEWSPTFQLAMRYFFQPSRLNGLPLEGKGEVVWKDDQLAQADAVLHVGDNRLRLQGKQGAANDRLALQVDLADLAQLGPGFAGTLQGEAAIQGGKQQQAIKARFTAKALKWREYGAIRSLEVAAAIEPDLQQPLQLTVQGEAITVDPLQLTQLNLAIKGTRANHTIHLQGQGNWRERPIFMQAGLTGTLPKSMLWQGSIAQWQMGFATGKLAVQPGAKLQLGWQQLQLAQATLISTHSEIAIQQLAFAAGKLATQGRFVRLNVQDVLAWLPNETTRSNIAVSGRWQLTADETVNGQLELKHQQGDTIWYADKHRDQPKALKLTDLYLNAVLDDGDIAANGSVVAQAGTIKATLNSALSRQNGRWGVYSSSPLNIQLRADISDLATVGTLIDPNLQLAGRLHVDVHRVGTVARSTVSGVVRGSALSIHNPYLGLALTDGVINADITPDQLIFERFSFKGGRGALRAEGRMGLYDRSGSIKIIADRLTAVSRPDTLAILTGQSTMFMKNGNLAVQGRLHIDEANLQWGRDQNTPKLSNDVFIVGRSKPQPVKTENFTLAALQLEVELGEKTFFRGQNIEALLGGSVHLAAQAKQPLYATGVIRVDKGVYQAYGQDLTVKRGFISFQGPLENPGLDLLAVREGPAVEAGVQVSGTAIHPRVILVSTPPVPDNEKISWIMFGKGTDTLNPQDATAVLAAASAAFFTGKGPSIQQRIAAMTGLDEVGIHSGKTAATATTTYLTLGKRLADNLYLGYEQSLGGIDSGLKLQYIISKHLQAVAKAGTKESTFDVFYTIGFD